MKTRYTHLLMLPMLAACMWSCSDSLIDDDNFLPTAGGDGKLIKEVVIRMPELKNADTRTLFDYNEETGETTTKWLWDDVIGVVPVDYSSSLAHQVKFPLSEGDWTNEAKFDGGAWSLKTNVRYAAYFPFSADNYEKEPSELTLSYEGQVQENDSKWHTEYLGKYDFMAARAGMADENGSITFEMQRLGGVVGFRFPAGLFPDGLYNPARLVLSAEEPIFGVEQELDLTGDVPVMTPKVNKKSISVNLQNFYLYVEGYDDRYDDSYAYMMLPPMEAHDITLSVFTEDGIEYFTTISDFSVTEGAFNPYTIGSMQNRADAIIVFEDASTKAVCVSRYDTNRDGKLSYGEAAAVTDNVFTPFVESDGEIGSFKELQYFTGLTQIPDNAFMGSVTEVILPEGITRIGYSAFSSCGNLTSVYIPESVTSIGMGAFSDCASLTQINLPDGITDIDDGTFYGCTSLTNVTLPANLEWIGQEAFSNTGLTEITIPASVTSLGTNVFKDCGSLIKISFFSQNPPTLGDGFSSGHSGLILYVPYDSYDAYKYNEDFMENGLQNRIDAYIEFDDYVVREICETNFDKNGDGQVSIKDLANVSNAEVFGIFAGTDIVYFPEFHYFTNLSFEEMDQWMDDDGSYYSDIFANCRHLNYIWLPENCTTIFSSMFAFTDLWSIEMPAGLTRIGSDAFFGCNNLQQIYMFRSEVVPELKEASAFHMVDDNGDDAGINPNLKIYANEDDVSVLQLFKQAANDPNNNWHYYKDYFVNLP